jgi:hypothetical protein
MLLQRFHTTAAVVVVGSVAEEDVAVSDILCPSAQHNGNFSLFIIPR